MPRQIDELAPYFDRKVIDTLKAHDYSDIWEDQWESIQICIVKGRNIFIGIPTGSGKTFPAMLSIIDTVLRKKGKAIYIVPLRALAKQKYDHFTEIFSSLGISVGISTGDYAKCDYADIGRKDVIIATIEKVDSLIRHNETWLYDVSLFVIDEIQVVGDRTRGMTLEIVVSEIIRKFGNAQRIALSAVIGNPEDFKNWLMADVVYNENRIIPLYAGVLTYFGGLIETKRNFKKNISVRKNLYRYPSKAKDPGKSLRYSNTIDLAKYFVNQESQCIIFTNARDQAEKLAISLANDINKGGYKINKNDGDEVSHQLNDSIEEKTRFSKDLIRCASYCVGFHHAGIHLIQRDLIEKSFKNNKIKVLVATPTLEQGVNLPSNAVIVSDTVRWNSHIRDYVDLPVNSVLNMMGRAGRPGYHEFGEAILIEDQKSDNKLYGKYIAKKPEKVLSQLRLKVIRRKHLNGLIASNKLIPSDEILDYFKTTLWFAIYKYKFEEFDLKTELLEDLSYLEKNGFIKKSANYFMPTQFGKATSDSCIDCETGLLFLSSSEKIFEIFLSGKDIDNPWPFFQLLLLSSEVSSYRPYDEDQLGLKIASEFHEKGLMLTHMPNDEMPNDEKDTYSKRSLLAMLFCDWIEEKPIDEITKDYPELSDADFYEIGDVLEWLGDAFVKIAVLNGIPKGITDKVLIYCDRAVGGVKEELLDFLRIEGVRRKSARALFNAGLSYDSLKKLNHSDLSQIVGPFSSKKIREHFEKISAEGEEPSFNEDQLYGEVADIIADDKQTSFNLVRLEENINSIDTYIKDERIKEKYKTIKRFCKMELSDMHSDSGYFRFFTNHSTPHSENILNIIVKLLDNWDLEYGDKRLSEYEFFLLAASSWCHDLGMLSQQGEDYDKIEVVEKARKEHAKRIIPYLEKNHLLIGLNDVEKNIIGDICTHHSSKENINEMNDVHDLLIDSKLIKVRIKLLSALLRLSDALDIGKDRLPREEHRNHDQISDIARQEYEKNLIVNEVVINPKDEFIYIQIIANKSIERFDQIHDSVKQKLTEEFESVKKILLNYGINKKIIKFVGPI